MYPPIHQDELSHILRQQLDLKWEAYNLYKFSTNFRHELQGGLIHFPQARYLHTHLHTYSLTYSLTYLVP
jgi:hypothetical protein